mgnify:CR=1 FL=1
MNSKTSSIDPDLAARCGIDLPQSKVAAVKVGINDHRPQTSPKPSASGEPEKRRFNFQPISKLVQQHPGNRAWWIRSYIPANSVVLVYGDPACGKTTIVTNIAMRIASQTDWCGIPAKQGSVLYVAAEDFYGARLRIEAAFDQQGIHADRVDVLDAAVVIADENDVDALIEYIKALPEPPALLVVDTLALSMGKFSENNDMQLFCNGATKIKRETGLTVIVIHHCGHGDKGRSRGGSQLPANADAIFAVERREDICVMTCQKMKNGKEPPAVAWRMETQKTKWLDEDGAPITSVILESVTPQAKGPVLGDNQRKALELLKRMFQEQQDNLTSAGIDKAPLVAIRDWNRAMKEAGIPRNRSMDARATLLDRKLIEMEGDCYVRPV